MLGSIHIAPLLRRFPHLLKVDSIGYMPHKEDMVDRTFDSINFSFILRGDGRYWDHGVMYPVTAPCVITQWPGVPVRYGPDSNWEELFIIYSAACLPALTTVGFASRKRLIWQMRDTKTIRQIMAELSALQQRGPHSGYADRIDRICEFLILESLLQEKGAPASPRQAEIRKVQKHLDTNFLSIRDYQEIAAMFGFSLATFHRHWTRVMGITPKQYVLELKFQLACRLLAETEKAISQIAETLEMHDTLYFSRWFHQRAGVTASAYRQRYRLYEG